MIVIMLFITEDIIGIISERDVASENKRMTIYGCICKIYGFISRIYIYREREIYR